MSELGEYYQEKREENQKKKAKNQKDNTEIVMFLAGDYGFEVKVIASYHLRLSHPSGKPLDYFPQTGRATWLGTNRWFKIKDIEMFIMDNWEKEPDYCNFCKGLNEGSMPGLPCPYCNNGIKRTSKEYDL